MICIIFESNNSYLKIKVLPIVHKIHSVNPIKFIHLENSVEHQVLKETNNIILSFNF